MEALFTMAMNMKYLCFFLFLQLSNSAHLRSSGVTMRHAIPMLSPGANTLEPGFSYSKPIWSGCNRHDQPEWAKRDTPEISKTPAKEFNVGGWNGFCQMGWSLCPDARANKDYQYYAKGVGPVWVRSVGSADKEYCGKNGWLKPEIASIVHNFTALQAKGEELCKTKYAIPFQDTARIMGVSDIADVTTEEGAHQGAAWNCALGDLACDLAYCNYAYCEKGDGSFGMLDECEGWDKVHGMPLTRTS